MTYLSTQTRVMERYAAARRPLPFDPITIADAVKILTDTFGTADAIVAYEHEAMDWLAGLGDKVTDAEVYADVEANGAAMCATAIAWALRQYTEQGDRCFSYVREMVEAAGRRGLSAGMIRGLLNTMRAQAQRDARDRMALIGDAPAFTDDADDDWAPAPPPFTAIVAFMQHLAEGQKRPKVRIATEDGQPVVLTIAGPDSRTPGALNVTDGGGFGSGTYYGRITTDGNPEPRLAERDAVMAALRAFAANPEEALVRYGRLLGSCGICGRTLVDPVSIERGIGPICANRGGF